MAMLVLPDVFERTWAIASQPFWPSDRGGPRQGARPSASWPRCTGISSGRCSSRGSTTPTTSGSTTAFEHRAARPCASTCPPGSTSRTPRALPREPRRAARRGDVPAGGAPRRGRDHLPHARACGSSTRGSARAGRVSRCTSAGAGRAARRFDRGVHDGLLAVPQATVPRRAVVHLDARPAWEGNGSHERSSSSPGPGRGRRVAGCGELRRTPGASATSDAGNDLAGRAGASRDRLGAAVYDRDGADPLRAGFISTCRRGATTPSR